MRDIEAGLRLGDASGIGTRPSVQAWHGRPGIPGITNPVPVSFDAPLLSPLVVTQPLPLGPPEGFFFFILEFSGGYFSGEI